MSERRLSWNGIHTKFLRKIKEVHTMLSFIAISRTIVSLTLELFESVGNLFDCEMKSVAQQMRAVGFLLFS